MKKGQGRLRAFRGFRRHRQSTGVQSELSSAGPYHDKDTLFVPWRSPEQLACRWGPEM